jgi:outer membrane receptor for ferrienterochelin and colicins
LSAVFVDYRRCGSSSVGYVLFALLERRFGRIRLFVNAENLGGIRQTEWDPLVRPSQAVDGRWTVDAWAPLDCRVINGGVRFTF